MILLRIILNLFTMVGELIMVLFNLANQGSNRYHYSNRRIIIMYTNTACMQGLRGFPQLQAVKQYAAVVVLSALLTGSVLGVVYYYLTLPVVAVHEGECVYILDWDSPKRKPCPKELPGTYMTQNVGHV